jgi:hypothetical protein
MNYVLRRRKRKRSRRIRRKKKKKKKKLQSPHNELHGEKYFFRIQ